MASHSQEFKKDVMVALVLTDVKVETDPKLKAVLGIAASVFLDCLPTLSAKHALIASLWPSTNGISVLLIFISLTLQ